MLIPNSYVSWMRTVILYAIILHSNSFICAVLFLDLSVSPNFFFIAEKVVSTLDLLWVVAQKILFIVGKIMEHTSPNITTN